MSSFMSLIEKHKDWPFVKEVLSQLKNNGHTAYLAGGCVRDLILKRHPQDIDVATDATPQQVSQIFPQTLEVGQNFGVSVIPYSKGQVEVTTFRTDGGYQDHRRPQSVVFSNSKEDALRRDFTINALFLDITQEKIYDYVGGLKDLSQQLLRTVGDPRKRFSEDHLRPLRALRFGAQLALT